MSVLLLDTYSLFFRAFYALPPMHTQAGEPTQALYGFSSLLLKLLREERARGVALALDRPEPTFRHLAYDRYKSTRPRVPSELARQLVTLEGLLEALDFPRFSAPGFEADDVLATLAQELAAQDETSVVVSGDRDLLQLAGPHVSVLFVGQRGKPPRRYDEAAVVERFGVTPGQLPAYVALIGDASDNIPKLKGVGPVAAQKLVSRFGDMSTLLAHHDEIAPPRLRALVLAHADQLRTSEMLVRLRRDVPLCHQPRHRPLTAEAVERARALFEALEFQSLIPRLEKLALVAAPPRDLLDPRPR